MKKIIFRSSWMLMVGLLSFSCVKESVVTDVNETLEAPLKDYVAIDQNDYSKLQVLNGVLAFDTYEDYESLINDGEKVAFLTKHIQGLNFVSFAKANPEAGIVDDFLGAMLNENQVVKIGKWYIKVNMETEKVYASAELNAYNLVMEERETFGVYTFSTSDDVFDYLNNSELLNAKGLFCNDPKADKKYAVTYEVIPAAHYSGSLTPHFNVDVKYVKAGIYHALRTEMYHLKPYYTNYHLKFWFQLQSCDYAQRCGSSVSNYSHPWITPPSSSSSNQYYGRDKYKFYSGSKQLKSYDFKVRGRCESTQFATPYSVYFTNWVHIQD